MEGILTDKKLLIEELFGHKLFSVPLSLPFKKEQETEDLSVKKEEDVYL